MTGTMEKAPPKPTANETLADRKAKFWERTDYDRAFRGSFGQYMTDVEQVALERVTGDQRFGTVLDLGCGHGRFLRWVAQRADRVVGLDRSIRLLGLANEWQREEPLEVPGGLTWASATELPYASGSIDAITCVRVLQHVPDQLTAFAEIRRVLKPDGKLILIQYNKFSAHGLARAIKNPVKALLRWGIRLRGGEPQFDEPTGWTTWPRLRRELADHGLIVERATGAWLFPLQYFRNKKSNQAWGPFLVLANIWEKLADAPFTRFTGGYIVVSCRPKV